MTFLKALYLTQCRPNMT